jgi:dTDP-L-rhamnose 4-epimerase
VRVLITGGAGFIGSHLADKLIDAGHSVRVLDALIEQVHGEGPARPAYLNPDAELIVGDVRDPEAVRRALDDVDAVYHFAARVGVGQSMYEIAEYTSVNTLGTAVLLEALLERPVKRLIVASSMSIYGEGRYSLPTGKLFDPPERSRDQLARGRWELTRTGAPLAPVPTPEDKTPTLASIYALGKYDQERMCLMFGQAYNIPAVALRFFNVYGTRQALSNPYTGVLAIFASRLLNDQPPLIFEDGDQRRDFVSVHDVADACVLALESPKAVGRALNIGSGRSSSVIEIAEALARVVGKPGLKPQITGKYRVGDIRHCFADISLARECLGYRPGIALEEGLVELAAWLKGQVAVDRVESATRELAARGLTLDARPAARGAASPPLATAAQPIPQGVSAK